MFQDIAPPVGLPAAAFHVGSRGSLSQWPLLRPGHRRSCKSETKSHHSVPTHRLSCTQYSRARIRADAAKMPGIPRTSGSPVRSGTERAHAASNAQRARRTTLQGPTRSYVQAMHLDLADA